MLCFGQQCNARLPKPSTVSYNATYHMNRPCSPSVHNCYILWYIPQSYLIFTKYTNIYQALLGHNRRENAGVSKQSIIILHPTVRAACFQFGSSCQQPQQKAQQPAIIQTCLPAKQLMTNQENVQLSKSQFNAEAIAHTHDADTCCQ